MFVSTHQLFPKDSFFRREGDAQTRRVTLAVANHLRARIKAWRVLADISYSWEGAPPDSIQEHGSVNVDLTVPCNSLDEQQLLLVHSAWNGTAVQSPAGSYSRSAVSPDPEYNKSGQLDVSVTLEFRLGLAPEATSYAGPWMVRPLLVLSAYETDTGEPSVINSGFTLHNGSDGSEEFADATNAVPFGDSGLSYALSGDINVSYVSGTLTGQLWSVSEADFFGYDPGDGQGRVYSVSGRQLRDPFSISLASGASASTMPSMALGGGDDVRLPSRGLVRWRKLGPALRKIAPPGAFTIDGADAEQHEGGRSHLHLPLRYETIPVNHQGAVGYRIFLCTEFQEQ